MWAVTLRRRQTARRPRTTALVATFLAALLLTAAQPPNDPLVSQQAHLQTVGAFTAWDIRRGEGAVVAVLDTGVDLAHPDLAGRLVEGIDLVERDTPPDDPQGHGTIVAGVIAAAADNGRGVAGVAPQAQVLPIRVLDAAGRGTSDVVAEGIRYAIQRQVQVINLSLAEVEGEDGSADGLLDGVSLVNDREVVAAIEEAHEAGIMVVAAAGNDGRDRTPYEEDTPALVVGATDGEDHRWADSNHDDRTIFAPGVEILSTWSEQRYARSDGTSFATPIVAAGAAMLMGAGMDVDQAMQRLIDTAVPLQEQVGLGRVDLAAAVQGLEAAPPTTAPPPPTSTPPPPPPPPPPPSASPEDGTAPQPAATGPLEVAEPVQEVPAPTPATVTEPPPPIAAGSVSPLPTTPPPTPSAEQAAELETAEAVAVPPQPSSPPLTVEEGGTSADDRAAATTIATVLLGVDVLLAGWLLAGRKRA